MSAEKELEALTRLMKIARGDTGQCKYVANFLLAWWNADSCGGFNLTDLWGLDAAIAADIVTVTGLIARYHNYPTAYGLGPEFERLVALWRPHLLTEGEEKK